MNARPEQVASVLRRAVQTVLGRGLNDPRVRGLISVTAVDLTDGKVEVTREVEGGKQTLQLDLPAMLTTQKGLNEPRYASLKGIMAAKKKEIAAVDSDPGEAGLERVQLTLPPARPEGKIVGEGPEVVVELVRLLKEEAKVL